MEPIHVIAEIAWGHDGKLEQAIQLAEAAYKSGANSLSIHVTSLPDYIVSYYGNGEGKVSAGREDRSVYEYLEEINLTESDWIKLAEHVRSLDIELCVMVNDIKSFEFTKERLNPDYYVIPPASMVEYDLIQHVALAGKPTIFRIGGSYLGEIEHAITLFRKHSDSKIVLLHGFQNYPTELRETDLALLPSLRNMFNVEVGLADHIAGDSNLAKVIPAVSVPLGVSYIEKHLTLDREMKSEDFESALNPDDFRECVEYIRAAEIALGTPYFKDLNDATMRYRNIVRKRLVFSEALEKGTRIERKHVQFKRCDIGLDLSRMESILGRTLQLDVLADEAVTDDKFI